MFPARLPSLVEHNDARRNSCPITTDGYAHTHSQRALKKEKTVTRGEERFMFAGRDEKKKGAHCSLLPRSGESRWESRTNRTHADAHDAVPQIQRGRRGKKRAGKSGGGNFIP